MHFTAYSRHLALTLYMGLNFHREIREMLIRITDVRYSCSSNWELNLVTVGIDLKVYCIYRIETSVGNLFKYTAKFGSKTVCALCAVNILKNIFQAILSSLGSY
jgi:hypothetical protein